MNRSIAPIILASRSRERLAILQGLGLELCISPVDFDESPSDLETATELVERLAYGKAKASLEPGWIIAADTVVVHQGHILGKPIDREQARSRLMKMSGQEIQVYTGTAVRSPEGEIQARVDGANLKMQSWTASSCEDYLTTELWVQRAGGFSVGHQPCPVQLLNGRLDVVRGIHGEFVLSCLKRV